MKFRNKSLSTYRILLLTLLISSFLIPIFNFLSLKTFNVDFSNSLNTHANSLGEDSILWKFGKGLPGTGATMKPRLVNFTENGESLITVGTNGGIATITSDGFINMSYKLLDL